MPSSTAISPSISIAIPTYEAGMSLVRTVESILAQTRQREIVEILIAVDGKELPPNIQQQLSDSRIVIKSFFPRAGQAARINDLCRLAKGDLLILTNDDVQLDSQAIEAFIQAFHSSQADLLTGAAWPLKAQNFLQQILSVGYEIHHQLLGFLNNAGFLTCNGRMIALSRTVYPRLTIPDKIWNNDAFIYFWVKFSGGKTFHVPTAKVFFRSPSNVKEHLKQSQKFQVSQVENQQYFQESLTEEYQIPKRTLMAAIGKTFFKQPFLTTCYIIVLIYSRILPNQPLNHSTGFWQTDLSTKMNA